jgi:hypothetical protein
MFLNKTEIDTNLHWLKENASPPVAYLTHLHLLQEDPSSPQMKTLWEKVERDPAVLSIFSLQNPNGSWFSGGPWGPRGYRRQFGEGYTATRPKFVTTAWILPFLGEMGFGVTDERIRNGADFIRQELKGYGNCPPQNFPADCCGISAVPLWALASVGLADDALLKNEWAKLVHCQRSDGGWLNPHHLLDSPIRSTTKGRWPWDRSCVWGSYFALRAFAAANRLEDARPLHEAASFVLSHLSTKNPDDIKTWVYHGHNIVRELEIFADAGLNMAHPTIQTILEWLQGYYRQEEGVFRTQGKAIPDYTRHVASIFKQFEKERGPDYWPHIAKVSLPVLRYGLYHVIEDDWLTYRLTRLAMKLNER